VMATLGLLGYVSSALVRIAGNRLMRWRTRLLAGV
jgi:ABC-type nitrate/sulfonate/bicarbonate transport system permease component